MERMKNLLRYCGLFGLALFACSSCVSRPPVHDVSSQRYVKYNIHFEQNNRDARASYMNWTEPARGHRILPVNSLIEIGSFRNGITIIVVEDERRIYFEYDESKMHMTAAQYVGLITSPTPIPLDSFSQLDRKGISEGKAYVGMSKRGVMTALGYPAAPDTPSPDMNRWVYWKNLNYRTRTCFVQFDDKGLVNSIGDK